MEENKEKKDRLYDLLELATKFYEKQLWDGPGKGKILEYLRGRGLSDESIRTFRLGYAPDGWRHMLEFLASKGYRAEELEAAGITPASRPRAEVRTPILENENDPQAVTLEISMRDEAWLAESAAHYNFAVEDFIPGIKKGEE